MARKPSIRTILGLTEAQEAFARYLAIGHTQTDSYRKAHNCKGLAPAVINTRAQRLASKPIVIERAKSILKELRVSDIDSAATAYKDLLDDIQRARAAENWTALAAFSRLRLQVLGMLQEIIHLHAEEGMSDSQIIERLAGKDKGKADVLKALLSGEKYASNQGVTGH